MNRPRIHQRMAVAIIFIAACAHSISATAQNVYKCGGIYSDRPCAGATVLQSEDVRSKAQAAQSREVVARDRKAAVALEEKRLAAEAQAGRSATAGPAKTGVPVKPKQPVAAKAARPGVFIATVPGKPQDPAPKKKPKARKKDAPPA